MIPTPQTFAARPRLYQPNDGLLFSGSTEKGCIVERGNLRSNGSSGEVGRIPLWI